jgi:hypothetical protein
MLFNAKPRAPDDRRQLDGEPPRGWKERRRTTERRLLEIEEHEVSESDWLMYFGSAKPNEPVSPVSTVVETLAETAADILGNARD